MNILEPVVCVKCNEEVKFPLSTKLGQVEEWLERHRCAPTALKVGR